MEYINIADMFNRLNEARCEYVVLRNYDNLLEENIYLAGHGDIDMLCRNVKEVVEAIGAETLRPQYGPMGDNVHFYVMYKNQKVSIDVRSVGDGYYCRSWEEDILRTRILNECFYIMNKENHLYSLMYHAIFQKPALSEEYRKRLSDILGGGLQTETYFIDILEVYMKQKNYNYVFCKDFYVPLRHCMHDKSLCHYTWKDRWPHFKFEMRVNFIAVLVKIKHTLWK